MKSKLKYIKYLILSKFIESPVNYKKKYNDDTINLAKGEIYITRFSKDNINNLKFKQYFSHWIYENGKCYGCFSIYLGENYAKLISKVEE